MKKSKTHPKTKVPFIKKKENGKRTLSNFGKTVVICLSVMVFLSIAIVMSVNMLIDYYYGLMDYVDIHKETLLAEEEIDKYLGSMDPEDSKAIESAVEDDVGEVGNIKEELDDIVNIMLLGVDNSGNASDTSEYGTNKHTDSMIIVTINRKTKKIVLTSLLRDSAVKIQRQNGTYVVNRLNTAYIYGGYKELFATVERNFAIEVDKFVQVNFASFKDIVNIVGGVDIYVTEQEAKVMNESLNAQNKLTDTSAGKKHLNAEQALVYVRIRKRAGDDFGRTERQRKLILAIAEQIKTSNVGEINELLTTMLSKVTTNLTKAECSAYISSALEFLSYETESFRIPANGTFADIPGDMLSVSFVKNYTMWKELVTGQ